jgi:hypothetical protein
LCFINLHIRVVLLFSQTVSRPATMSKKAARSTNNDSTTMMSRPNTNTNANTQPLLSLAQLCQNVIVNHLEKYPPEIFVMLSDIDFESLIRLRHSKTKPKERSGGLDGVDGTGRVAPAIRMEYMAQVEACNPHLAQSNIVDTLIWKDCVEFRFKRGGQARPRALYLPWPLLVEQIQAAGDALLQLTLLREDTDDAKSYIDSLESSPMNVSLLQATGIGKVVKRILKQQDKVHSTHTCRLKRLLDIWKELAAQDGIKQTNHTNQACNAAALLLYEQEAADLKQAETCQTWRQLFAVLKHKEETRRASLGQEMRERRRHLASDRPRIVKVRPTVAKHERILAPDKKVAAAQITLSPQNRKLAMIRKETSGLVARSRQKSLLVSTATVSNQSSGSFGAAVAFAANSKKTPSGTNRSRGNHVQLAGGKSMTLPCVKSAASARRIKQHRR